MLITFCGDGLSANHIPCGFEPDAGERGRLIGHVARNDAVWREIVQAVEALLVFQQAQAYLSPIWFPTRFAGARLDE